MLKTGQYKTQVHRHESKRFTLTDADVMMLQTATPKDCLPTVWVFISSEAIMLSAAVCILLSLLLVPLCSMHAKSNHSPYNERAAYTMSARFSLSMNSF